MDFTIVFLICGGLLVLLFLLPWLLGVRYIPNNRVGIVEQYWSLRGSLKEGGIIALKGEAGFQADILRGGLHFGFFPWQFKVHIEPLVVIAESKIGYVYARDGSPLPSTQTLGSVVNCNTFQDARGFLANGGQRGRQRSILREGLYALNLALFVVITEDGVYSGPIHERDGKKYGDWLAQLMEVNGFSPVVIGHGGESYVGKTDQLASGVEVILDPTDTIGIVTVHDGAPIESGEIIAPEVKGEAEDHQYFQDPEAFLRLGGRRGKQLQVLTDGTFFINRWFATAEIKPKTMIPIGYVGVVVGYYGERGRRRIRHGIPLRRAGGARTARRVEARASAGEISAQPVRAAGRAGADGELRPALDHRDRRGAPVRQGPDLDRADHGRRVRAGAAALAGAAHRLRKGAVGHPALRRRAPADQPDARSDPLGLLPRRGAILDHAGSAAQARGDPSPGDGRTRPALRRVRHQLHRGDDRPAGEQVQGGTGRAGSDRAAVRPAADAPLCDRAEGDLPASRKKPRCSSRN